MKKTKYMIMAGIAALFMAASVVSVMPSNSAFAKPVDESGEEEEDEGGGGGNGAAQKAMEGFNEVKGEVGAEDNLNKSIGTILTIVYSIIGIVAVIMVILGGVSYATSQGDAGKLKKGKDTILYGIIGLIIVLLAFAITNFVLSNLGGGA
jgi:hypothetical protein